MISLSDDAVRAFLTIQSLRHDYALQTHLHTWRFGMHNGYFVQLTHSSTEVQSRPDVVIAHVFEDLLRASDDIARNVR